VPVPVNLDILVNLLEMTDILEFVRMPSVPGMYK
jgi:hypothetical protein